MKATLLSFPLLAFTLLLFSLAILFRGYALSFLLFHPAARTAEVPSSLQFNHATFLLYGVCYSESAPACFTHLAFIHPQVGIFYCAVKLLLCLWHVLFTGR